MGVTARRYDGAWVVAGLTSTLLQNETSRGARAYDGAVRTLALLVMFAAACGGKKPARDDAAVVVHDDAAVPADAALPACANPSAGTTVTMRQVAAVGVPAVLVTSPPNDPRLFVVEQRGAIQIIENGQLAPALFLDISDENGCPVVDGGEMGLLGLAFDPAFAQNGEFYVTYTSLITPTDNDPFDNLARYRVSATDRNVADPKGWTRPRKVLDRPEIQKTMSGAQVSRTKLENGWYPVVIGTEKGETDKVVGRTGRFFMSGLSRKRVTFLKPGENPPS